MVSQADPVELQKILIFLKNRALPSSCGVHNIVNSALRSKNTSYRVYYLKSSDTNALLDDNNNYLAITGFKEEGRLDPSSGTFKKTWYSASWSENGDSLLKIYEFVDTIDWAEDAILIYSFDSDPIVVNYLTRKKGENMMMESFTLEQYMMDESTSLDLEIEIPDEVYIDNLKPCHAQIIYDNWPYSSGTTLEIISKDIDQLPTVGIFLKENHQLVTWMMNHPPFGLSRLHTLESYRRRGYANLAVKSLAKKMAEAGYLPISNVVVGNVASSTLFTKSSGFKLNGVVNLLEMFPNKN